MKILIVLILAVLPVRCVYADATMDPLKEYRHCGPPARNADGTIKRSAAVIAAFRAIYPCPSTGLKIGACPGWSLDHTDPLADGGCDAVYNLAWMPDLIKSSAGIGKDRYERPVFCVHPEVGCTPLNGPVHYPTKSGTLSYTEGVP